MRGKFSDKIAVYRLARTLRGMDVGGFLARALMRVLLIQAGEQDLVHLVEGLTEYQALVLAHFLARLPEDRRKKLPASVASELDRLVGN